MRVATVPNSWGTAHAVAICCPKTTQVLCLWQRCASYIGDALKRVAGPAEAVPGRATQRLRVSKVTGPQPRRMALDVSHRSILLFLWQFLRIEALEWGVALIIPILHDRVAEFDSKQAAKRWLGLSALILLSYAITWGVAPCWYGFGPLALYSTRVKFRRT